MSKFLPELLTINEASNLIGLSKKTLRRWEEKGILHSQRTPGGHRRYLLNDIKKLKSKREAKKNKTKKIESYSELLHLYTKETPKLYKSLDPAQKSFFRYFAIASFIMLGLLISTKFLLSLNQTYPYAKRLLSYVVPSISKSIKEPTNVSNISPGPSVLQAATSLGTVTFNVGVGSSFKEDSSFEKNVDVLGDFTVTGATNFSGSLTLGGNLSVTGNQNVTGTLSSSSVLNVGGISGVTYNAFGLSTDAATETNVSSANDLYIGGDLQVGGSIYGDLSTSPDATTLDSIDSTSFLRSDESDGYTSGTLTFSDGTLLDLSSILQNDTSPQGLKLPQGTSFSNPSSGEGYLAWDSTNSQLQVFNGTSWSAIGAGLSGSGTDGYVTFWTGSDSVSGSSSFYWDNTAEKLGIGGTPVGKLDVSGAVTGKALAIFNETGDQNILSASASGATKFVIDHSGNVGINTSSPTEKLDVAGNLLIENSGTATDLTPYNSYNLDLQGSGWNDGSWSPTTIDGTNSNTAYTSILIGQDGYARILYHDDTNDQLVFVQCTNSDCSSKVSTVVDSTGIHIGEYGNSMKLGSDGYARIAYSKYTSDYELDFIQCTNAACTSKNTNVVDNTARVGNYTSIALDSNNYAYISYRDSTNFKLKFAHCTDAACSSANVTTPDTASATGLFTSIALGQDGFPRISYYRSYSFGPALKYIRCGNADCTSGNQITSLVNNGNYAGQGGTSLSIASDGYARIAYFDGTDNLLRYIQCTNDNCSTKSDTSIETNSSDGFATGSFLQLDSNDYARIAYFDKTSGDAILKYARCTNDDCSTNNISTIDSSTGVNVGYFASLALDSSYNPHISYASGTDLNYINQTSGSAVGRSIYLSNVVTDSSSYKLSVKNNSSTELFSVDESGNMVLTGNLSLASGANASPDTNLGSDLGTSSLRWNNLYVGTINSNSTLDQTGQALFTYDPTDTTYTQASVLINPTSPSSNELMLGIGQGGNERAGFDAEGDLTLGYDDATTAPTSDNPLTVYGHSGTQLLSVNLEGSLTLNGISSSASSTEGTIYYDSDDSSLYVYTGAAFSKLTTSLAKYSNSDSALANGGYVEVAHNQNTNDIQATGWYYDTISSLWRSIDNYTTTIKQALQNEFDDAAAGGLIRTETAASAGTSTVQLQQSSNLGTGGDGSITVSSNTDINTTNLISGRSCSDGGDAVNYSVTALTSNTATLSSSPSSGCLVAGDEVLLINLQATASAQVNAGNFETLTVDSIFTNTVTFTTNKTKYYGDNSDDDTNIGTGSTNQKVMLQRVPNYTDVTINTGINFYPDAFDGTKGGVMFFRATGTVTVTGTINVDQLGYRGGANVNNTYDGGGGGESFCGPAGTAAGDGGYPGDGGSGSCGGGGGSGANDSTLGTAGTGSSSAGGAGGGGGGTHDGNSTGHGYGGGAGGAGYGTVGTVGTDYDDSAASGGGGTNFSGDGGHGFHQTSDNQRGGFGGAGGSYGDSNLNSLFLGSGGGAGGDGTYYSSGTKLRDGGAGGKGGGIVFISADTITVSGGISSNGGDGGASEGGEGGTGGGGSGGSVKLSGNTISVGSSIVTASGGAAGSGGNANGGAGGDGRIAIFYTDSATGTTSPSAVSTQSGYYPYGVYHSAAIPTSNAISYDLLRWEQNLNTYGNVEFETRSGNSTDPTDGTWEAWKPSTNGTNYTTLQSADTHTDWSGTNATVAEGDVTRNVDYYEDEDESTAANITKLTSSTNGGYAEATISSTDISSYDYITLWVRASQAGTTLKFGFGESAATEQTENITIDNTNTWQKVYWDISDITGTSRDAVTKLRITNLTSSSNTIYIDNVRAASFLSTNSGSVISSTPDNYIQYRAILTTTNTNYQPSIENVTLAYKNGFKIEQTDANTVRMYNYTGSTQNVRLDVVTFGADLAEWYATDDSSIGAGEVVALTGNSDQNTVPKIAKADSSSKSKILGIISTKAGQEIGLPGENRRLVALSGRVPVKINPDSPNIAAGDFVTASDIAGLATRATTGDYYVGKALEAWTKDSGKDTITVFMNLGYLYYDSNPPQTASVAGTSTQTSTGQVATSSASLDYNSRLSTIEQNVKDLQKQINQNTNTLLSLSNISTSGTTTTDSSSFDKLLVLGKSVLADTTVNGQLNVGIVSVDGVKGTIDAIGPLKLQPSSLDSIEFQGGSITMDQNGNLYINKGVIYANDNVRGSVTLSSGQTSVKVTTTWETTPKSITATANFNANVWITDKSNSGFTINVASAPTEDKQIDWIAFW